MSQILGDWNTFNDMSEVNKTKVVNFISRRFDLSKEEARQLLTELSTAGYAYGGNLFENSGKLKK